MSRPFNDTTTGTGLVQQYELEIGAQTGDVSGNTTRLQQFASATRTAWDRYLKLAFKSAGSRQFDDSNHTKYPFIEADLVQNQRDYEFIDDEQNNLILEIHKVMVKDKDGTYFEALPIDQQLQGQGHSIWDGQNDTGVPTQYDKTGSGIIFDLLPDYSWRNGTEGEYGIKIFINREPSYFVAGDTTKKPGCPGIHHDYFFLRPALEYARRNGLSNYDRLYQAVVDFEGDEERGIVGSIERHFSKRNRDERTIMTPKKIKYI